MKGTIERPHTMRFPVSIKSSISIALLLLGSVFSFVGMPSPASATPESKTPTTIRLYNHSEHDLEAVSLMFLNETIEFGDLPAASASEYIEVEAAYPIANVSAVLQDDLATTLDDDPLVAQPYDYVDVEPLHPGPYTYQIDVNAEFGVLEVTLMEPVVEIEMTGGLCEYGGCYNQAIVYPAGIVIIFAGSGDRYVLEIDPELVTEAQDAIAEVDIADLRAVPFTGTCPTAHDGQEIHYTFERLEVRETISTCEYAIDPNQPPFPSIQALWDAFYPLWLAAEAEAE
ncbi:MAG: hypothetical protein BroJett018_50740 [Chloroflexota bacterium]|nr:MAG: hypothetical protein BroJett018_50740 [Chloroflexota bacterium]